MSTHEDNDAKQRAHMLDLIKNLCEKTKKVFQDGDEAFKPIKEWTGVTVDMDGNVIEISWDGLFLDEGSLEFQSLPPSLKSFNLHNCNIVGNLPLKDLPRGLKDLLITNTNVSGTVNLDDLPEGLRSLDLSENHLEGSLSMGNLPKTMEFMFLSDNGLSGPLNLCALPADMQLLDLAANAFTDDVVIGNLPKGIVISFEDNPIDHEALVKNCQAPGSFIENTGERITLRSRLPGSQKTTTLAQLKGIMIPTSEDDDSQTDEGFTFEDEEVCEEWDSDESSS
mmetsp:Transcript_19818/g.31039  ORF Transcript_19818/g.31039 Transcript_19818/m.31039 type:complete len:281 (-) Transcript_19818:32-874(-)